MNLRRTYAIFLRQIYLLRGSATRLVPLFVWVAIDIVLWGFITKYLGSVSSPGFSFVPTLLGAVLLWDFLTRVMQGVTMAFFEDVWSRNFLNIFATPMRLSEYLGGMVLSSIATSAVGLVSMVVLASFFGLSLFTYGALIVPFLLVLFLFGIALGIFGTALVLRLGPAAEWFVWPIPALISPFACVFYPMAVLPGWMQAVAHLLPPAYVFESVRALAQGHTVPMENLWIGGALSAGYILLAYGVFVLTHRHAVKSGLIARYSAESVG